MVGPLNNIRAKCGRCLVCWGRANTCAGHALTDFGAHRPGAAVRVQEELAGEGELPPWLGEAAFHRSHRSAPEVYTPFLPDVTDDLPYVWAASDRVRWTR
ncbi:hypothetical protein FHS35_001986 [Streptomyces umbrinus]|uniref:hypothetical protein n=1 Tax=Streptomyces umbrinus TaxID=67370 RepID=UPI0019C2A224|nr:hypothetical protein [Streptomyces umbrinus]GHH62981.1 hypothetical protein GCM10018775_80020 [Streptomyces umbrinus]